MRNYFKRLNILPHSDKATIKQALKRPASKQLSGQAREDARSILGNDITRRMYRQAFVQYQAMRAATDCIESSPGVDTNHWLARLSNFDLEVQDRLRED